MYLLLLLLSLLLLFVGVTFPRWAPTYCHSHKQTGQRFVQNTLCVRMQAMFEDDGPERLCELCVGM